MKIGWVNIFSRRHPKICTGVMLLCTTFCTHSWAEKSLFCGAADQLKKIQLIPIAQMDTDMVLASVANIEDFGMSSEQRLLNHYWLLIDDPQSLSREKTETPFIAISFTRFTDQPQHAIDIDKPDLDAVEHSAMVGFIGDYSFRIASESVLVGFHKRF